MAFRFLHCSDIHLLSVEGSAAHEFLNKRLTGVLNLLVSRRRKHDESIFAAMLKKGAELGVDAVAITGDLTNLSLESEFAWAAQQLEASGLRFFVIPGNHDAYVDEVTTAGRFLAHFGRHALGDENSALYPMVRRTNECALIGVSSALATAWFSAAGEIGSQQLKRLDELLRVCGEANLVRIVMVHHPVTPPFDHRRRGLRDAAAFRATLLRAGAELVLHGHEHRTFHATIPGPSGPIPVHAIASGTSMAKGIGRRAAFSVYEVQSTGFAHRLFTWQGGEFREVEVAAENSISETSARFE
jgi:3',5'-cyclic AMP phosphodiesterase CpdA